MDQIIHIIQIRFLINHYLFRFHKANHTSVLQAGVLQSVAHLPVAATELLSYLQLHFLTNSFAVVLHFLKLARGAHLFHADVISVQANFLMLHSRKSNLFYHNFYLFLIFDDAKLQPIFHAYNSSYPHSETLRKNENTIRKNLRKIAYLRPLIRQKKRFTMLFLRVVSWTSLVSLKVQ